jgi:hypothetical protein
MTRTARPNIILFLTDDHFDTFSTICELCGVDPTKHRPDTSYPGRSYLQMAGTGADADWDDARYGEYGDLRMIRTSTHKLVRRYPDGPDDLFDLVADPGEKVNPAEYREPVRCEGRWPDGTPKGRFWMRRCPGFRLVDEIFDYHFNAIPRI